MMKKFISIILVLIQLVLLCSVSFAKDSEITVIVDNNYVKFDVQPFMLNGRVLVPFRTIAEALHIKVDWNAASETITAEKNNRIVIIKMGSKTASVNGEDVTLDVPAMIKNGRSFVPVRFFSESFSATVSCFDDSSMTVFIKSSIFTEQNQNKEFSLLNDLLKIKFPEFFYNSRTNFRLSGNYQITEISSYEYITLEAKDMFSFSTGDLKKDAQYIFEQIQGLKEKDYTLSEAASVNGLEIIKYEVTDSEGGTDKGALIKMPDNSLVSVKLISPYYSQQAKLIKQDYFAFADSVLDTIQPGSRKIDLSEHTEAVLDMKINISKGYRMMYMKNIGQTVYHFNKISPLGEESPGMSFYISGLSTSIHEGDVNVPQKSSGNILGNKVDWLYYTKTEDSDSPEMETNVKLDGNLYHLHVIIYPTNNENLTEMKAMAQSLTRDPGSDGRTTKFRQKNKIIATSSSALRLRPDGTVAAVGDNYFGDCDVSEWRNIVSIAAGDYHTVGLDADGTVVAIGTNDAGECDVKDWTDIVDIAAGDGHTVGLKSDGTVVATGDNYYGQCNVEDWTDIVAVYANCRQTAGIKSDGTVVTTGRNDSDLSDVTKWADIVDLALGAWHIVGLKSDGTVVAAGSNRCGQCDVSDWKDIVDISSCTCSTIGVKSDGTLDVCGEHLGGGKITSDSYISRLKDVKAISTNDLITIAKSSNYYYCIGETLWNSHGEWKKICGDTEENNSDPEYDNPSPWAAADVAAAIKAELVPQFLQNQYAKPITRFEFCELAAKLYETVKGAEIDITGRRTFNDIKDVNVEKMAALGVVNGTGRDMFSPDSELTREQAATMLSRLAAAIKKPLKKQAAAFSDNGSISSWAFDSVGQIQSSGIMGGIGNNTFAPKNPYTREQSIVTLLRLYNMVK